MDSLLAFVSDHYSVVKHRDLLATIESAIEGLDVGPVPRGIYLENDGQKMRAIFKCPALERAIQVHALDRRTDRLCPLIKVSNSLDGTSKILIEIAYRRHYGEEARSRRRGFMAALLRDPSRRLVMQSPFVLPSVVGPGLYLFFILGLMFAHLTFLL